jgi:hypothetical protein
MRDHLLDLVGHTFDLGCIDLVKIVGDENTTAVTALAEDLSVVIDAKFNGPVAEFVGTFGMPNLGKLKVLLALEEYRENAKITIKQKEDGSPESLEFENAVGDFRNSYRFMSANLVNARVKEAQFKGVTWNVEFEPMVASVQRLKWQNQANSEELHFQMKTENGNLKFYFGDQSTHAGNFVFHTGVNGTIKRAWSYPVKTVISILDLVGDKTFRISDEGAVQITVDSGLAVYNYILPAQSK